MNHRTEVGVAARAGWDRGTVGLVLACGCVLWCAALTPAGGASQPPTRADAREAAVPFVPWVARLSTLEPTQPERYLELAEEILDNPRRTPEELRLATTLLVLCVRLDLDGAGPARVGASACLALADTAVSAGDKARFRTLAASMRGDPSLAPSPGTFARTAATASVDAQIAALVGAVRSGDGVRARLFLGQPEVRDRLQELDRVMTRMSVFGGAAGIVRESQRWPCTSCGNQRIDKRSSLAGAGDGSETKVCAACKGRPGPRLSDQEYLGTLRFEAWLLRAGEHSWAADLSAESSEPYSEPDIAAIARSLGVDIRKSVWLNGAWALPPSADTSTDKSAEDAAVPAQRPEDDPAVPVGGS